MGGWPMGALRYLVDRAVFDLAPGYVRGVVVAEGVDNAGPSPDELVELLRAAETSLRERLGTVERLVADPRVQAWRAAYRGFGARPSEFHSSIEMLGRRVLNGRELPAISRLVDIGTVVALRHVLPAGAHPLDGVAEDLVLRRAAGGEPFRALGAEGEEQVAPGEVILAAGGEVLTRRWTWRQSASSACGPDTRVVEVNVDGLPPVGADEVAAACAEVAELITRFCGGRARHELLHAGHPEMTLLAGV
jgi:DNA/RNA-binding domain of Phe-tRNA-synthetase-like protein